MIDVFMLSDDPIAISRVKSKCARTKVIKTNDKTVTVDVLDQILKKSLTKYFYIISSDRPEFLSFDFSYVPNEYDSELIHVWDDDLSIRLYNRKLVKQHPGKYTDEYLSKHKVPAKIHDVNVFVAEEPELFVLCESEKSAYRFLTQYPNANVIETKSPEVTNDIIKTILDLNKPCSYFYIVRDVNHKFEFDFKYSPPTYESQYIHIWNNDWTVRLYNTSLVKQNPELYSDMGIEVSDMELKSHEEVITQKWTEYDIIFLSYDEPYADEKFKQLQEKFPRAKRVHGIKGIFTAHKAAANLAETPMFYVVDADAVVRDNFKFDYMPPLYDQRYIHVWRSKNPINGLIYGYGGVKLFPTQLVRQATNWNIDFTTSLGTGFKAMPMISNETAFNTDGFNTWRSAFRECVKLASGVIENNKVFENEYRIHIWCTEGADKEFGHQCTEGAKYGKKYGYKYRDMPELIKKINDYEWLEHLYQTRYLAKFSK